MTGGEWALIVLAGFWAVLVVFLALVLVNLFRVLDSTKVMIDGLREETLPLLSEVRTSVVKVNRELDQADRIISAAGTISQSLAKITTVVEQVVSNPLIKAAALAFGASKAIKRFRGEK